MQVILSDGYELSGPTEVTVEIDVAAAMPPSVGGFYFIEVVSNSGGDPVSVVPDGYAQTDPLKCALRVQVYSQRFGPFKVSRGNPKLIIGPAGADTGAYTIYALTDEQP